MSAPALRVPGSQMLRVDGFLVTDDLPARQLRGLWAANLQAARRRDLGGRLGCGRGATGLSGLRGGVPSSHRWRLNSVLPGGLTLLWSPSTHDLRGGCQRAGSLARSGAHPQGAILEADVEEPGLQG